MTLPGGVRASDLVSLGALAEHVPMRDVRAAIAECGVGGSRRRLLPPELTALYVIAMCLYRNVSYVEVLRCLFEGLRWLGFDVSDAVATKGAITQARGRLGWEVLCSLFGRIARPMAGPATKGAWYRTWRTVAMDGATMDVADTPANAGEFGYPAASRGTSAFPQIRCVVLSETGTHAAFACAMGPYKQSEASLAKEVLPRLEAGMLLLADRGFFGYEMWTRAQATKADLLWRVKNNMRLPLEKRLSDGSFLSRIYPSPSDLRTGVGGTLVRVVEYKVEGSDAPFRLVTTILDPDAAPAQELAALYQERWEAELIFDEIKTHLKGSKIVLRSKTPALVKQEFWGLMVAHRALRSLMHQAAVEQEWDPDDLSFVHTVRVVKRTMPRSADFSP
jgi:hypothetical protein